MGMATFKSRAPVAILTARILECLKSDGGDLSDEERIAALEGATAVLKSLHNQALLAQGLSVAICKAQRE